MQIKIPNVIFRAFEPVGDWLNVAIYRHGENELRRIDVLVAFLFVACVGWYAVTGGWLAALQGGAMFIFVAMVALWFF